MNRTQHASRSGILTQEHHTALRMKIKEPSNVAFSDPVTLLVFVFVYVLFVHCFFFFFRMTHK
jgi:hypothetical protein